MASLYVFALAAFLGYQVISRVPPLLHTPLMSATNAISAISLVGSLVTAGGDYNATSTALGFVAIVGTLVRHEIVRYDWIIAGLILGSLIGAAMSIWMPMTAMPERTALSHAFGALAASLVGISEYYRHGAALGSFKMTAIGFEVMF